MTTILSPEHREKLHRSLERMKTEIEQAQKDIDKLMGMHNGIHPDTGVKDDNK